MLVYRVELPDGTGPWCNPKGEWHNSFTTSQKHVGLSSWSFPCSIRGSWPKHEKGIWKFGFTNWEHFFNYCNGGNWDTSRRRKLEALNIIKEKEMVISVYEVDDRHVIDDKQTQCVFRVAEATLVEKLDSLSDVVMEQLSIYLGEPVKQDISLIKYPGHQTNYEGITI